MLVLIRLPSILSFFFFNDTATTEIYTLSLHDALPIYNQMWATIVNRDGVVCGVAFSGVNRGAQWPGSRAISAQKRSEEHTSELQSRLHLVCRLLLEKKKKNSLSSSHLEKHSCDCITHT